MKKLVIILLFALKAAFSVAQCDVNGILLELQATTDLSGFLIGEGSCITTATVAAPLDFTGGVLSITSGDLTEGSSKVVVTGGADAVLGVGATVDIVPANILLNTLGGALDLAQLSTTGATNGQIIKYNGSAWVLGTDDSGGLSDGDYGDITVGGSGTSLTIDPNVVSNSKFRQGAGLSVVGRSAGTTGNVADIVAGTDAYVLLRTGGAVVFGQIETGSILNGAIVNAKIANSEVSYSKLQNAVANNVLLGNNNGAGTAFEEINMAALQTMAGYVDGAGTANRLAYWTDANTLSNDAAYTVDAANDRLTINGTIAATGANNAWLNLNGGSIGGTADVLRASANISSEMRAVFANARNIGNSGDVRIEAQVGGTTAGDPYFVVEIPSGSTTVFGEDNSDGDKFKITPGGTKPGSAANSGLIITHDSPPRIGVNKDNPLHALDVAGVARSVQFRQSGNEYTTANVTLGTGAGTGAFVSSCSGGNNGLQVNFTTGTSCVVGGTIFTLSYTNAYGSLTYVTFNGRGNPGGVNVQAHYDRFNIDSSGANDFVLKNANGVALDDSKQYALSFTIMGY